LKATVEDWLHRSEAAGRLLSREEYLALVEADRGDMSGAITQRRRLKTGPCNDKTEEVQ
jgi:hypothetical protein